MTPHAPRRVAVFGGDANYMRNFRGPLLRALRERGCRVTAICPDDGKIGGVLSEWGVHFAPVALSRSGMNPLADLMVLLRLFQLFRREKIDVLLAYTIKPIFYGLPMARLAGVRRRVGMVTGIGYALTEGEGLKRSLTRRGAMLGYKIACAVADRMIFQNTDDRDLFRDHGLLRSDAQAVLVAGSGVDLERFTRQPLPPEPITFVMVSRLLRDKGVYEYVAAAKAVKQRHPQTRFLLVGGRDQNPTSATERDVEAWRQSGAVELVGEVDDVRPYLAGAHVFVLPSYREGTPRSGLEAMAVGRAIVTSDAPGCREIVRPGVNGVLVPIRDADALAEAMALLVGSPRMVQAMAVESRRLCEERFDAKLVTADMIAILLGDEPGTCA